MINHVIVFAYPLIEPATLIRMRELAKRTGRVAKSGLMPDETPPWMQHARAYKREPSVTEGHEIITGYAAFSGLRGSEADALKEAVKEVNPKITVNDHHQRVYSFVTLTPDEATKVEKILRSWRYSNRNHIDLLRRSLDLKEENVLPRRTRRTQRTHQTETLFK